MKTQKISTFFRNTGAIASLVAAATVATGFMASSASALSLVPSEEGEVDVGLGACLSPSSESETGDSCEYLTLSSLIGSVESVANPDGTFSRLFVDDLTTANNYGSVVKFQAGDAGTVPEGFWFRPSELEEEQGQLEVGTFRFNFTEVLPELKIAYFDTESSGTTGVPDSGGVLDTDGVLDAGSNPILPGPDGNISYQIWKDVSFITLKLGQDNPMVGESGDGVDFQLETTADIPEPASTLGLGALGLMGALGLRKRNKNLS